MSQKSKDLCVRRVLSFLANTVLMFIVVSVNNSRNCIWQGKEYSSLLLLRNQLAGWGLRHRIHYCLMLPASKLTFYSRKLTNNCLLLWNIWDGLSSLFHICVFVGVVCVPIWSHVYMTSTYVHKYRGAWRILGVFLDHPSPYSLM